MQSLQAALAVQQRLQTQERRRHSRMSVALLGRYMLADRQEYPCQTND
ncbi:MAG: PilZ domain-containing protein, partial [Xanthobacteraceae bacterium]